MNNLAAYTPIYNVTYRPKGPPVVREFPILKKTSEQPLTYLVRDLENEERFSVTQKSPTEEVLVALDCSKWYVNLTQACNIQNAKQIEGLQEYIIQEKEYLDAVRMALERSERKVQELEKLVQQHLEK